MAGDAPTAYRLLQTLAVIRACLAFGGLLSSWLGKFVTLPGYIGAMLMAAIARNLADGTRLVRVESRTVDTVLFAFLLVPMVGAFFVDFSNAMVITTYLNFLKP